jgi:hypothetical protein
MIGDRSRRPRRPARQVPWSAAAAKEKAAQRCVAARCQYRCDRRAAGRPAVWHPRARRTRQQKRPPVAVLQTEASGSPARRARCRCSGGLLPWWATPVARHWLLDRRRGPGTSRAVRGRAPGSHGRPPPRCVPRAVASGSATGTTASRGRRAGPGPRGTSLRLAATRSARFRGQQSKESGSSGLGPEHPAAGTACPGRSTACDWGDVRS